MSKHHYIFKPLFIDTFEYFYKDGNTEKSFTIKKKSEPRPVKPKMQQSEPLASFDNETIQNNNNKRAQTSRRMKSSSFVRNSTINSNTPINKEIRKVESRNEDEITIQPKEKPPIRKNFRIPETNYLNFNIAIMSGEASHSFNKALELIKKDTRLMKKQNRQTKTPSTQCNDVTQLEYMENSHNQDVMEKIGRMFSISEQQTPMRKKSKTREAFTRNLQFLDQSFQEVTSPDKKLKSVIQNYFDKKQAYQEEQSKKQEIQITELSQQTKPNRRSNVMRISTTFLKQFVDQQPENVQPTVIQKQESTSQSIKSSYQQKHKKKANTIFSGQVRHIFKKMFHLIVGCVRKMKQMKLTTAELFRTGVFYKKPYEREGSFQFFEAIEENNVKIVNFMLQRCRYYAFDINEDGLTALHLSALKGFRNISEKLLQNGAYPDSTDSSGKTPLYYAIQQNHYAIVVLLLYYKANPWSEKTCKYTTDNDSIRKLVKKSRRLQILLLMTKHLDREQVWINSRDALLN